MIRLFSEHLAGRLVLGPPDADLLKKRRQRVNALRSAHQHPCHVVLGAAKTDDVHRRFRVDRRTRPATDMEGNRRLARMPNGRRHFVVWDSTRLPELGATFTAMSSIRHNRRSAAETGTTR